MMNREDPGWLASVLLLGFTDVNNGDISFFHFSFYLCRVEILNLSHGLFHQVAAACLAIRPAVVIVIINKSFFQK